MKPLTLVRALRNFVCLVVYSLFYVLLKNFSLICRRHHCRWRAAKFWPMLGTQGLWAERDLNHATPAVTWGLGFYGLIQRTTPFSLLLRHTKGWGRSILIRILTGQHWEGIGNSGNDLTLTEGKRELRILADSSVTFSKNAQRTYMYAFHRREKCM
jgi:hypothetical protein